LFEHIEVNVVLWLSVAWCLSGYGVGWRLIHIITMVCLLAANHGSSCLLMWAA